MINTEYRLNIKPAKTQEVLNRYISEKMLEEVGNVDDYKKKFNELLENKTPYRTEMIIDLLKCYVSYSKKKYPYISELDATGEFNGWLQETLTDDINA